MTIKTNEEGRVILQIGMNLLAEDMQIVKLKSDIPFNEDTKLFEPEPGVIYVDEFLAPREGYDLYFDGEKFSLHENPNYAEAKIRAGYINELRAIKRWFFDTDWHHNKITAGEWTKDHEDWLAYLAERTEKRARQDEVLALLKIEKSEQKAFLAAL